MSDSTTIFLCSNIEPTLHSDAFIFMPGVPCFHLAVFTAEVHFFASGASRESDVDGPPALVAVLKQRFPKDKK